jgi:hypothetical protein
MKKYVIVDENTGVVKSIMQWADKHTSRIIEIPTTIEVDGEMQEVIEQKEIMELKEVEFPSSWIFQENEKLVICEDCCYVNLDDVYYEPTNEFYILDVSDDEMEISELQYELAQLELELSNFQEATWIALMIDETQLPQIWQDRLNRKRAIRARLSELGVETV